MRVCLRVKTCLARYSDPVQGEVPAQVRSARHVYQCSTCRDRYGCALILTETGHHAVTGVSKTCLARNNVNQDGHLRTLGHIKTSSGVPGRTPNQGHCQNPRYRCRQPGLSRSRRSHAGRLHLSGALGVQGEEVGTGLLTYPALMAADILLYQVGCLGAPASRPPPPFPAAELDCVIMCYRPSCPFR